jgi:dihydroflavonol-4-reductase
MTAVVTGASGHIGANLVRALIDRGERVRVVAHRNTVPFDGLDVEVVRGDVLDGDSLVRAFRGGNILYHLAAVISIEGDPHGMVHRVNVKGALNAAQAALTVGVRRMVHCSSVHAFDMHTGAGVIDESSARVPEMSRSHAAYDASKADGERQVRSLIEKGLDAVIVHPTGVIGPRDFEPSRMGHFFLRLQQRSLPSLVRGGFDFVDVGDVVSGLLAAAERGGTGESYLLSGHSHKISDLARMAEDVTGVRGPRLTVPMWLARAGVPVIRGAARITGSHPLYTAESLAALRSSPRIDRSKAARDLGYAAGPIAGSVAEVYRWFAEAGRIAGMSDE